ncbi:hypothetical protein [Winogradskyella psychrotolerans]|nr:hypothetical protein [Winogradskyella psychrotolerans]MBU2927089.1 hypothetical protein [Winogradskyella psychrotolerans]
MNKQQQVINEIEKTINNLLATVTAIESALKNNDYSHELGLGTAQLLKHF